jgi:zinc and cadmium transporter
MAINPFIGTLIGNTFIWLSIVGVVFFVGIFKKKITASMDYITALTVGLLTWIVFLWFIPKIVEKWAISTELMGTFIIGGILIFYILEMFLHWHHCHDLSSSEEIHIHKHEHENGALMMIGTIAHNFLHGVVLFSAFALDFHFGLATTFAIFLHSIPQNVANYIMNHNSSKFAYIAAFWWFFGALITFPFYNLLLDKQSYILAMIWGWLLYTAMADIFPHFKSKGSLKNKLFYIFFIVLWVILFLWSERLAHWWEEHNEEGKVRVEENR